MHDEELEEMAESTESFVLANKIKLQRLTHLVLSKGEKPKFDPHASTQLTFWIQKIS